MENVPNTQNNNAIESQYEIDFKQLCSLQSILSGVDFISKREDDYLSDISEIVKYHKSRTLIRTTLYKLERPLAEITAFSPKQSPNKLKPITSPIENKSVSNFTKSIVSSEHSPTLHLNQCDLTPIAEKEKEDDEKIQRSDVKKPISIKINRKLEIKSIKGLQIRPKAESVSPPKVHKEEENKDAVMTERRRLKRVTQHLPQFSLESTSVNNSTEKMDHQETALSQASMQNDEQSKIKRSQTFNRSQKLHLLSIKEQAASTNASNRVTPVLSHRCPSNVKPMIDTVHEIESIRELLGDLSYGSTVKKCNTNTSNKYAHLVHSEPPKYLMPLSKSPSPLKDLKERKKKIIKDPYSIDWNFKILKEYYSVKCEDKGTTVVGLPQFRIKKIKSKHPKLPHM